jgi:hypothetical protein
LLSFCGMPSKMMMNMWMNYGWACHWFASK